MKNIVLVSFLIYLGIANCDDAKISFDADLDENCMDRVADCPTDAALWNSCPIACATSLEPPIRVDFSNIDSDDFLALTATDIHGKTIRFENYDGYVTLVTTVPSVLVPYYYEMLEHLQSIYPFALEVLMIPLEKNKSKKSKIVPHENGKVVVLTEADKVLDYFTKDLRKVVNETYATGFLFSVDDDFLQVHHSPNMETLKDHIRKDMIKLEDHQPEF